jgi:leucyl aminopeptidase
MTVILKKPQTGSVPLHVVDAAGFAAASGALSPMQRQWLATLGFQGAPDTHALLPGDDGRLAAVWAGARVGSPWALALLPRALPAGRYHLAEGGVALDPALLAMAWQLGSYSFGRYKAPARRRAAATGARHRRAARADGGRAMTLVRDLVNLRPDWAGAAGEPRSWPAHGAGSSGG